jgi:hypothetical protein
VVLSASHSTFALIFRKLAPSVTLENTEKMKIIEKKFGNGKSFTISLQKFRNEFGVKT